MKTVAEIVAEIKKLGRDFFAESNKLKRLAILDKRQELEDSLRDLIEGDNNEEHS